MTIIVGGGGGESPWEEGAAGVAYVNPPQALAVDVPDNNAAAFRVFQGATGRAYLEVDTRNGVEQNTYGSGLDPPRHLFLIDDQSIDAFLMTNALTVENALRVDTVSNRIHVGSSGFAVSITCRDNIDSAGVIEDAAGNDYFNMRTANGSERCSLGNSATNPEFFFLGNGRINMVSGGVPNFGQDAAISGAAGAVLGTTGGATGPATADQDSWLEIQVNGVTKYIALWD